MRFHPVSSSASPFRGNIGLAHVDITPPVGIFARNWGAAKHDTGQSIHRPLRLNALAISSDGGDSLLMIDADLGFWTTLTTFESLQSCVLRELGLRSDQFLFALTHTHASPHLSDPQPGWEGGEILRAWLEDLTAATIQAGRAAMGASEPALLEWHWGKCQLAAPRDLPDLDSETPRIICGYNPTAVGDDTLLLGRITTQAGFLKALIVNYACHPTTLAWDNTSVSPDFIGAMRETLTRNTAVPAFFLQGASGELAPRWQYVGDPAVADQHGRQLAYAALAALEDMNPPGTRLMYQGVVESGAPLAVWKPLPVQASNVLSSVQGAAVLPLKNWPTTEELDREYRACPDRALAERLRRKRNIRAVLGDGTTWELPVYAWRLGDAIIVGSMAEAYSDFQTEIRQAFPDHHVTCLNVVNGSIGYLCPEDRYDLDVYQAWQSPFDRGSLQIFIAEVRRLVHCLLHPVL